MSSTPFSPEWLAERCGCTASTQCRLCQIAEIRRAKPINLPCIHEGRSVPPPAGQDVRKQWLHCEAGLGIVCRCQCNARCHKYEPEEPDLPLVTTVPGTGVVIGTYGLPKLAEVQIRLIRQTCGQVPILIADDAAGVDDEFEQLALRYSDVTFWPNLERRGHYAGDLSVFWKGLQWAHVNGLKWLCKLSQRFLWTRSNWLRDAVESLQASKLPTMFQGCIDNGTDLYIRSECVLMSVSDWAPHFRLFDRPRLFNATEFYLWDLVYRFHASQFCRWTEIPHHRERPKPGSFVWHTCNTTRDYVAVADSLGLTLDAGFTVAGWMSQPGWKRG